MRQLLLDEPFSNLDVDLRERLPHGVANGKGLQLVVGHKQCCGFCRLEDGAYLDVLLRADDIVHDDDAPVKAEILRKAFRGAEFLYTLRLASGDTLMAHVPSHHDHKIDEWIGIRAQVDHVVTFDRESSVSNGKLCRMPCEHSTSTSGTGVTVAPPVSLLPTLPVLPR